MTPLPLRLLITGSRNWPREHLIHNELNKKLMQAGPRGLILVHGGCPDGADIHAHRWYERVIHTSKVKVPLTEEIHSADWDLGPSAGFRRNEVMVRMGAWGVLGFVSPCVKPRCKRQPPIHGSHGTMHCLKVAKHYHLPIKAWKVNW